MITVKDCKFGRGVFATETIPKGAVVEVSPYIFIPKDELKALRSTVLAFYDYKVPKGSGIALGVGSLFNHKSNPNVDYFIQSKTKTIKYKTNKKIRKGAQLFIDYGYDPVKFDNTL